jgi:hypothetical protein
VLAKVNFPRKWGVALANLKHETAARMIAEDREPDHRIATAVGVSRRTIEYWKHRPDVRARVQEIAEEVSARLAAYYARYEWLRERESCRMILDSKSPILKRAALLRLQEMSQWMRQAVFASLEKPPTEKPESPEIQPKHSPEQSSKVQASTPPPGEWAKHPGAYRKFKKYVGREPEACEWDSCLTDSE